MSGRFLAGNVVVPGPAGQPGRPVQVDALGGGEEPVPRREHPVALLGQRQAGQTGPAEA